MALHRALQSGQWDVRALLTTFQLDVRTDEHRVSHHEVPSSIMKAQADALGFPLDAIFLPDRPENQQYEHLMRRALNLWTDQGLRDALFGDIFLDDLRRYREEKLSMAGWKAHFPLWKNDTTELAFEFIDLGFRAMVVSVDGQKLPAEFCGRQFDQSFLSDLPEGVDPCGEHGEFHTFVYDGPIFSNSVSFRHVDTHTRTYQWEGKPMLFHFSSLEST